MLGRGNFAIVLKVKHKKTGNWVAIKIYEKYKMLDAQLKSNLIREIKILWRIG